LIEYTLVLYLTDKDNQRLIKNKKKNGHALKRKTDKQVRYNERICKPKNFKLNEKRG